MRILAKLLSERLHSSTKYNIIINTQISRLLHQHYPVLRSFDELNNLKDYRVKCEVLLNAQNRCRFTSYRTYATSTTTAIDLESIERSTMMNQSNVISVSSNSLNIISYIPKSTLQSICVLPEIKSLFSSSSSSYLQSITQLERAKEVFSSFAASSLSYSNPSEDPLIAVLILLAHYQNEAFLCKECAGTIREIRSILSKHPSDNQHDISTSVSFALMGAQAKVEWRAGNFRESERLAKEMDLYQKSQEIKLAESAGCISPKSNAFLEEMKICHFTALGLSKLLVFSHDFVVEGDIDSISISHLANVLNPLESAVSLSSKQYSAFQETRVKDDTAYTNEIHSGLLAAKVYGNYGIAQLILYFASLHLDKKTSSIPFDSIPTLENARESWKKGLSIIDSILALCCSVKSSSNNELETSAKLVKANLECNIAQSILFPNGQDLYTSSSSESNMKNISSDELAIASEYARNALLHYDQMISTRNAIDSDASNMISSPDTDISSDSYMPLEPPKPPIPFDLLMSRALSLVASCYARAGSAVTAQGLFQSSLDVLDDANRTTSTNNNSIILDNQRLSLSPYTQMWHRDTLERYSMLCRNWEKREKEAAVHLEARNILKIEKMSEGWRSQPGILGGLWFLDL